jgi:hypothetical protein
MYVPRFILRTICGESSTYSPQKARRISAQYAVIMASIHRIPMACLKFIEIEDKREMNPQAAPR